MAEKVLMIALSPTMEKGTLVKWNKKEGDFVKTGDVLCQVETDKATMEYESLNEGTLLKIVVEEGAGASIGETIAILGQPGEDFSSLVERLASQNNNIPSTKMPEEKLPTAEIPKEFVLERERRIKISPLARQMARKNGIELKSIAGSGPGGRIVKRDIDRLVVPPKKSGTGRLPIAQVTTLLNGEKKKGDERIPVGQKRKIIAQRLSESKYSAPHYYLKSTVTMDGLLQSRTRLNESGERKVSLNAFFIKFCAESLKRHPLVNATWQGEFIQKHGRIDIGFAVARPDGLMVPVVRDCGEKGILAIDTDIKSSLEKIQSNRLTPEEMQNATFTISNLGSFGIEEFTAIINPPGSAILALGEIAKQPAVENDALIVRSRMKMTLSCDHRVIDGAIGAAFLKELKEMMESPIHAMY